MIRIYFFQLLLLIFIINGCTNKSNQSVEFQVPISTLDKDLFLSEYADSIYYVRLQSSEDYVISDDLSFKFSENYILARDRITRSVYLYDKSGQFISKIGSKGAAPDEYVDLLSFDIDESAGKIFLGDHPRKSIISYDLKGAYIDRFALDHYFGDFIVTQQGDLLIFTDQNEFNLVQQVPTIHVVDYQGKSIHKTYRSLPYPGNTNTFGTLYHYGDRIHIIPQANYVDSAFYIDDNYQLQPYFELVYEGRIDKKSESFTDSLLFLPVNKGIGIYMPVIETKNLIFAMGSSENRYRKDFVFDKKTGVCYNVFKGTGRSYFAGLINDLDGGVAFYPMGRINESWVYNLLTPDHIQHMDHKFHESDTIIRDLDAHRSMKAYLAGVQEDDLMVLQIVRFKDISNL
jgi:hypothetical protein